MLHLAAMVGNIEAIFYLTIEKKVNVDFPDGHGCAAIELAITHGQLTASMALLRDTEIMPHLIKKGLHQVLLSLAIREGTRFSVGMTINVLGLENPSLGQTKLNIFLRDFYSPIHIVLETWHQSDNVHSQRRPDYVDNLSEILSFLISFNDQVCINRRDSTKGTPLWYALSIRNFKAACLILSSKLKVECPLEEGRTTSQHYMVDHAWNDSDLQIEVINLMIENAKTPSTNHKRVPQSTVNPELNARDVAQRVPLHVALSEPWEDTEQQIRVIQALLKNCSETINAQDESGKTPLCCLVSEEWEETPHQLRLIQLLLEKNSKLNITDKDKNTPLDLAAIRGCSGAAELIQDKIEKAKTKDPQLSLSSDTSGKIRSLIEHLKQLLQSPQSTGSSASVETSAPYATLLKQLIVDLEDYSNLSNKLTKPTTQILSDQPDSSHPISSSSSSSSSSSATQATDKCTQIEKRSWEKSQERQYEYMEMCLKMHQDIEFILEYYQTHNADDRTAQTLTLLLLELQDYLEQQNQQHDQLAKRYRSQLMELKAHGEAVLMKLSGEDTPSEPLEEISNALSLGADINSPGCQKLLKQAIIKDSFKIVQLLSSHNINMRITYEDDEIPLSLAEANNSRQMVQLIIASDPQLLDSFLKRPIDDPNKQEIEQLRANICSLQQSVETLTECAFKNTEEIIGLRKDVDNLNGIADVTLRTSINEFINHPKFGDYYRAFFEIFSAKMGNELLGLRASLSNWASREQSTVREGLSYISKLGSLLPFPGASLAISLLMKIPDSIISGQEEKYLGNPLGILPFTEDYDRFVRLLAFYSLELFRKQLTYFDKADKLSQGKYIVDKAAIDALVQSMVTRFFLFMFTKYFLNPKHLYSSEEKGDPMKQQAKSVVLSLIWFRPNKFSAFNFFKSIPGINQTVISLRTERDLTKYQKTKQIRHAGWRAIKGIKSCKADFEGFKGGKKQLTDQGLYRRALLKVENGAVFAKKSSRPKDYPSLHVSETEVAYINQQIRCMDRMCRKNYIYDPRREDDPALRTMTISYREYYSKKFALLDQQPGTSSAPVIQSSPSGTSGSGKNSLTTTSASSSSKFQKRFNLADPLFKDQFLDPIRNEIAALQESLRKHREYQICCLKRRIARLEGHPPGNDRDRKCEEIADRIKYLHLLEVTQKEKEGIDNYFMRIRQSFNQSDPLPGTSS